MLIRFDTAATLLRSKLATQLLGHDGHDGHEHQKKGSCNLAMIKENEDVWVHVIYCAAWLIEYQSYSRIVKSPKATMQSQRPSGCCR